MSDTDSLTDQQIFAATLIGEAENLGELGMTAVACVIMNRVKEYWFAQDIRSACLHYEQFSCWNAGLNSDRIRILNVVNENPTYGPYLVANQIVDRAMAGELTDITNSAVSYFNHKVCFPKWAAEKTTCYIDEPLWFYDLASVR